MTYVTKSLFDNVKTGQFGGNPPLEPLTRHFGDDFDSGTYWSALGPTTANMIRLFGVGGDDRPSPAELTNVHGNRFFGNNWHINRAGNPDLGVFWESHIENGTRFAPGLRCRTKALTSTGITGGAQPECYLQSMLASSFGTDWTMGILLSVEAFGVPDGTNNWTMMTSQESTATTGCYWEMNKQVDRISSPQAGLHISLSPKVAGPGTFHIGGGNPSIVQTGALDAADIDDNPMQLFLISFDGSSGTVTGMQIGMQTLSEATNHGGSLTQSGYSNVAFDFGSASQNQGNRIWGAVWPADQNSSNSVDHEYTFHESWAIARSMDVEEMRFAAKLTAQKWNAFS